eukprot:8666153-Alexandrium_andersonii.AAC.1
MSASLVGSEMCIRDRGSTPATSQDSLTQRCARETVGRISQRLAIHPRTCLLYTSDAADDM